MSEEIVFSPVGEVNAVANPAVGLGPANFTIPTRSQLIAINFTLVTSVTVANRLAAISFLRNAATIGSWICGQTMVASTTYNFTIWGGATLSGVSTIGNAYVQVQPAVALTTGDVITWGTAGIQAADQFSNINYVLAPI